MPAKNLLSLRYDKEGPSLSVLDQLLIPDKKEYIDVPNVEAAWTVIRSMQIRGAPLIAMVACLGLAVDLNTNDKTIAELDALDPNDGDVIMEYIEKKMDYLATSRPTAVNLFNALKELKGALDKVKDPFNDTDDTARERMCHAVVSHAEHMLRRDVSDNEAIGANGADEILNTLDDPDKDVRMVTICNTGSLATAGFGTALGVARALQKRNRLKSIVALETRPYNQGSRLTAFEIVEEGMPGGMLICDSAAATLMKTKGVDAVVVGADRVCANGDTANKIGTYSLAITAAGHGVPFYVASPFTTLDTSLKSGDDIEIEERSAQEIIQSSRAPPTIECWNPAFDVTPAKYITGIITEKGIIERDVDGTIDVTAFVEKHNAQTTPKSRILRRLSSMVIPIDYIEQDVHSLPIYLARTAPAVLQTLGAFSSKELSCVELGDGNLDHVFLVTNTENGNKVVVKQALPYVRMVVEPSQLSPDRAWHEYRALSMQKDACPEFVPSVHFFSKANGLLVMEYIPPPSNTLHKGLLDGTRYPTVASDLGMYCARTLFRTSGFKLSEFEMRKEVEFWSTNSEMCALTEQLVFTEPYTASPNNRWTSPQLDNDKAAIESDMALKLAVTKLKTKYVTQTQALVHGDLHSGSVLCSPEPGLTYVIDSKYAFYGPMGYDTGTLIANLMLAYMAQTTSNNDYGDWILDQIVVFWTTFQGEFIKLWNDPAEHTGMCYSRNLFGDSDEALAMGQADFVPKLLADTLGYAGVRMIRHLIGHSHVADLESIEDLDLRANCERCGLEIATEFIKNASSIGSIQDAVQIAKLKTGK